MQDKLTNGGDDALNGAESLAQDFVNDLAGALASAPESGKTYPERTVFKAVWTADFEDHILKRKTGPEYHIWTEEEGFNHIENGAFSYYMGECTCKNCTCSGYFVTTLGPGRYRLMNVHMGIAERVLSKEAVTEFTVEGQCKKWR